MLKRMTIYITGLIITALGIALIIRSMVGTGPWDTVAVGLKTHLGLTIGIWSIITQGLLIFITAWIRRGRPRFESILVVFIRSIFLDIWFYLILVHIEFPTSLPLQWIIFTIGFICVGLGIGIYIEAKFSNSPTDELMIAMGERFGFSFQFARLLIETAGAIIGFLLGGPVGIGTLIIALTLGNIIQITNKMVQRMLLRFPTSVSPQRVESK